MWHFSESMPDGQAEGSVNVGGEEGVWPLVRRVGEFGGNQAAKHTAARPTLQSGGRWSLRLLAMAVQGGVSALETGGGARGAGG